MEPDDKIIQIIPAPTNLYAVYDMEDGSQEISPIICLALTDIGNVIALDMDIGGYIAEASFASKLIWKDK